jgi:2-phospho-L-lactate guanylyltransferase (CobY/MobA/RfbA family)
VLDPLASRFVSQAAVLVPVKAFAGAKQRLSDQLSPTQRSDMARLLGGIVIGAAAPLPVFVVCDDEDVARWALSHGAMVSRQDGEGLNGALRGALIDLERDGYDHAVIVHADLPHAHGLAAFVELDTIVIVPDPGGGAHGPALRRSVVSTSSRRSTRHQLRRASRGVGRSWVGY